MKIKSLLQLNDHLTANEQIILDVLRQIITENLPSYCKEKISYNVPYFYGNKGICIVWPASIPRGGIKEGVLFGLWQGYLLEDEDHYLTHGTNKKIFYKIFKSPDEIDEAAITKLLKEAINLDKSFKSKK